MALIEVARGLVLRGRPAKLCGAAMSTFKCGFNQSVSNGRRKPFAGPFFRLPDGRVRIVNTDDGEELFTLALLASLLACPYGSKTRIVI